MATDRQTFGINLSAEAVDELERIADEFDTKRSVTVRAMLEIGIQVADDLDREKVEQFIEHNERPTAPEMIQDGHHPRWDE
jgi:metal-responsive CopG/Arc/MetJ family transcriptional regulator